MKKYKEIITQLESGNVNYMLAHAAANIIKDLQAENERLTTAIKWEQNHAERIGTHGPGCHAWGPAHWECAVREIERLTAERNSMKVAGSNEPTNKRTTV